MHPRLAELSDFVDAQRRALLETASAVPPERWTERPAADRWSVSEVCQHLAMVEQSCARVVAKHAAAARAAGHPPETGSGSLLRTLDAMRLTDRSNKRQAPDIVAPTGGWSREQALDALASSRAALRAAIGIADGLALESITFTHARLGEMDLYQWILFVGQHEARHREQLGEIAGQLGVVPA